MPLGDINIWRSTPTSRFGDPYARDKPQNLWQSLTPWKEEKGETFGTALGQFGQSVGGVFRGLGTPFAAPFILARMTPAERARYEEEKRKNWFAAHFGKESTFAREYEDLPLWGQLLAEAPAFLLGGGLAAAGAKALGKVAVAGGARGAAATLGRAALSPLGGSARQAFRQGGKLGGVAGRAAQVIAAPTAGLEAGLGLAGKGIAKVAAPLVGKLKPPVATKFIGGKVILPTSAEIEATFVQDLPRRFAQTVSRFPLMRGIVEAIAGPRAIVKAESKELVDITRKEFVKYADIMSRRHDVQGMLMPKLQTYGDPVALLKISPKGELGVVQPLRKGTSTTLTDVIENPQNYRWLDANAKKYVDDLRSTLDEVYSLAKKEGVSVPKSTLLHRMVRGKTDIAGYVESEFGSKFGVSRVFETQAEGVARKKTITLPNGKKQTIDAPIDYDFNPNTAVTATINHYMKKIAEKRFGSAMRKLALRGKKGALRARPDWGEGTLKYAPFRTKAGRPIVFPEEVVKTAERYLGDQGNKWLRAAAEVSGTGRLLVAALDFSAPFIQGLPVLGRRPDVWIKATLKHYGFAKDPKSLYRYFEQPTEKAIMAEMTHHGASRQSFEFYEAMAQLQRGVTGAAEKIGLPKVGELARKGILQTYGRAETAFTGFGQLARNEMWKATRRPNMSQGELRELATVLDRMTGVMSTERLGIGLTQREFENAFLFFAPRYTRAGLKLFADIFAGGLTGRMARQSLGQLAAGGMAMYMGVTTAMGQEPKLDPTKGDFMTIEIGGDKIGIGGMITSLTRFGADLIATARENPLDLVQPWKDKRLNRWDNPFIRFMYSKSAPLTGATFGAVVENADYFGRPFENIGDWAKFAMDKVTPIALQRFNPLGGETVTPAGAVGEIAGLRTFPSKIPKSPAAEQRLVYQQIEDSVWSRYSSELRKTADEIKKLEKENPQEARRLLILNPGIVMARRQIARQKEQWKTQQRRGVPSIGGLQ